ncbi:hypothetical protein E4634_04890 [Mangrovimicrobium sediminis]|uniref:PD-(D/E)XK endonuclease-like domain-containing protein n=1 Tax=Mangrovimicrobium sediminis TaxID=2562682 RepID=A0A4Z0M7D3_9GAMM|nr:PD-(D/E)XK nuclease family protein [Haliea sp. SAOS-164]TGD75330.1 hypothetical protein E4634_04890 [Haliea sp. SAOS-164]
MPTGGFSSHYERGALASYLEQGTLLLTPNQRLARSVKSAWDRRQADAGLSVWQPAPVRPLDSWLQQCWQVAVSEGRCSPRICLSALQERELWSAVIARDASDNAAYNLLQPGSAVDLASAARDALLQARLDAHAPGLRSEFALDADCATFLRWLQAFDATLTERGLATRANCLVDLLGASDKPVLDTVVLLDCGEATQLQQACVAALAAQVIPAQGAFGEAAALQACSWPERRAELAAVANWAAREHSANPRSRLGIVLGDMQGDRATLEYELRRAFDCLGEAYAALPVNFSTGITLERAPVVRDALRMLSCCERDIPLADILGLLVTRFAGRCAALDEDCVQLVQRLYADGRERVDGGRLRALAASVSDQGVSKDAGAGVGHVGNALATPLLQSHALRLHRLRQLPSAWVESLRAVLELWGWPGPGPLDSLEFQQVEVWYGVLEDFAACDNTSGELDFPAALALLRRCCQATISQPQTADSPVQVLGPLEAAGLQFDALWLCGMEASRWPAPLRPNPFIPVRLQRVHRMPHSSAEDEWHYAERLLQQYVAGSTQLLASYARQVEGAPELPSPLLREVAITHNEAADVLPEAWRAQHSAAQVEAQFDDCGPGLAARDGTAGGSAILQNQASCPFRAFAVHRLGAQVLDPPHAGLSARQRGDLLHDALFALWGALGDSAALARLDDTACAQALSTAVDAALAAMPEPVRLLVGAPCLDLEHRRLVQVLSEWLDAERARPPFRVKVREAPDTFQLGGLTLRLRVDRVDTLSDGRELVIDYKSGRCAIGDWLGERPRAPQLPLYALATGAAGVAFAQVRARDCRLLGMGDALDVPGVAADPAKASRGREEAQDWPDLVGNWQARLEQLARAYVAGEAEVDPLRGACDYCGLQALCRVGIEGEGDA